MGEPKSELTSPKVFEKQSDAFVAAWLENDADMLDGQPGLNNHIAAVRSAAERLRSDRYERGYRDGENNVLADDHDDNPNSRTSLQLVVQEAQEFIRQARTMPDGYGGTYLDACEAIAAILDKAVMRPPMGESQ